MQYDFKNGKISDLVCDKKWKKMFPPGERNSGQ